MTKSKPSSQGAGLAPRRRTFYVWAALLGSMTLASALLLVMEPGPIQRADADLSLMISEELKPELEENLKTLYPLEDKRWEAIVIHHSGQNSGSAKDIDQLHQGLGYGSNGYHFVIGNGNGSIDGALEATERWRRQQDSVYARRMISICLVGNGNDQPFTEAQMQKLKALVMELSQKLDFDDRHVWAHYETYQTSSPGYHFNIGAFRQSLVIKPVDHR